MPSLWISESSAGKSCLSGSSQLFCYCVHPLVPGTLRTMYYPDSWEATMYMRDSFRPKPHPDQASSVPEPRARSNNHPFLCEIFLECMFMVLLSSQCIYCVPSIDVGLCGTHTRHDCPPRTWKWNSDAHDSWDNRKEAHGVQTGFAMRSALEGAAKGSAP